MEHAEDSEGDELAYRLDADIELGDGWVDSLRVGVRRAEREQNINWSTYNWGSVQPLWGLQSDEAVFLDAGSVAGRPIRPIDLGSDLVGGGVFGGGTFIHPAFADRRAVTRRRIDRYGNGHSNSWVPLGQRTGCPVDPNSPGATVLPGRKQQVTEDVDAAYFMFKFGGDDTKIGNVQRQGQHRRALREDGRRRGRRRAVPDLDYVRVPPQPRAADSIRSTSPAADGHAFMNASTSPQVGGASHDNLLPSLNVRFGLTDEQFLRFAVSRALARPDMGLYKNYVGIGRARAGLRRRLGDLRRTELHQRCRLRTRRNTPRAPAIRPSSRPRLISWTSRTSGTSRAPARSPRRCSTRSSTTTCSTATTSRDFTNNGVTRPVSINGPITGDGAKLQGYRSCLPAVLRCAA